jgi:PAS domain S-box-containing protein
MRVQGLRRSPEELVLLAVSAGAAAVVAASVVRDAPPSLALRAATVAALVLSPLAAFAFWFAGALRRSLVESAGREHDAALELLSALPDGLLVLQDGRVVSVNRRFCELVGFPRDELLGTTAPLPFWPPEHRHEIERWHDRLPQPDGEVEQLVFRHRDGTRVPVLVAAGPLGDAADRLVVTVRDVAHAHLHVERLAELASRDPETGLLNQRGFEEWLREAVRQAHAGGGTVSVALLEPGVGWTGGLGSPDGRRLVERLGGLLRAGESLARVRGDELAWILPGTDAASAVKAVARVREELSGLGATLTAGVCDLGAAGDALALYAFADRALVAARRQGWDGTARYPELWAEEVDHLARTLAG